MKRLPISISWLAVAAVILLLLAGSVAMVMDQWRKDTAQAEASAQRELLLLASLAGNDLRLGDYQHVEVLLAEWGQGNPEIALLTLLAGNGFTISEYRRGLPGAHSLTLEMPIEYSYSGQAKLVLSKDTTYLWGNRTALIARLAIALAVIAAMLIALTQLLLLYRTESAKLMKKGEQLGRANAALRSEIEQRHEAEEALQRLNEELEARVQRRTAELIAARDEAERANLAKSEFLSRMSHELRTPLNAILGFGQLLELDVKAEQIENVQEILHAGQHLLDLINEVLDLARIESGKFTVSKEPVLLMPLIANCLSLIRPQAEARGIRIVETGRDCVGSVLADRTRLKQVLLNLLSNAVKYNRPQGSLSIVCLPAGDALQIRIGDDGAGLTPEQQARLFVAFERLDADQSAVEGTGIGLALSKRLMEHMEGEIGVDSTPGSGSTFWVRLPLADRHADPHPAPPPAAEEDQPGRPASQQQWSVLCIEDNPANLRLIERILGRRSDIRLLTAGAPGLGLELARAHLPTLILLDINLPDMDGYAVMQCLRENAATRDIPVVAISANAMPADLARGQAAGFVDYLTKPLDINKVMQAVYQILKPGDLDGESRDA